MLKRKQNPITEVNMSRRKILIGGAYMGNAKAHYDGIKAFSETDFSEDLKIIDVPTMVMHGDDDQIVPIAGFALLSVKLLKNGKLKVYEKFPHGMCTTHADVINSDLLAFIKTS
jgi:non-heme chloroperoxidase